MSDRRQIRAIPGRPALLLAVLLAALLAPLAAAEEIVHFKNGTSMPIRGHEVEGDMIRLDLGDNAFLAFPARQIDRIEKAAAGVLVDRSSTASNRVAPTPEGSFPVRGSGRGQGAERPTPAATPRAAGSRVEGGDNGVVYERPFAGAAHPARRDLRVTGSAAARGARGSTGRMNGGSVAGSNRVRLPSSRSRQFEQGVQIVPIALDPKRDAAPTPPQQGGGGSDGGGSDSSGGGDSGSGG